MVVHAFNPSTQEAEAGGALWVRGQPGLQELVPGQGLKATEELCLENQKKKEKERKKLSGEITKQIQCKTKVLTSRVPTSKQGDCEEMGQKSVSYSGELRNAGSQNWDFYLK